MDEAVYRAKEIKKIFDLNNIEILRMGLCSSDNINLNNTDTCIGAYHPAFGELVEGEIIFDMISKEIEDIYNKTDRLIDELIIETSKKNMSKVAGHNKKNILRLREKFSDNTSNIKNIKIIEKLEKFENVENVENNDIKKIYNIII